MYTHLQGLCPRPITMIGLLKGHTVRIKPSFLQQGCRKQYDTGRAKSFVFGLNSLVGRRPINIFIGGATAPPAL